MKFCSVVGQDGSHATRATTKVEHAIVWSVWWWAKALVQQIPNALNIVTSAKVVRRKRVLVYLGVLIANVEIRIVDHANSC